MDNLSIGKRNKIKLGYARTSTVKQHLSRQIKKLKENGILDRDIFTDQMTGKEIHRPGLNNMLEEARVLLARGYEVELIFDDISRFSRTSEEGQELYWKLLEEGFQLTFLAASHINSEKMKERLVVMNNIDVNNLGKLGKALKEFIIAIIQHQVATEFDRVQVEREEIVRKITEGLARPDVKQKLGKRRIFPQNLKEVMKDLKEKKINKNEAAKRLGISRSCLFKNYNLYLKVGSENE